MAFRISMVSDALVHLAQKRKYILVSLVASSLFLLAYSIILNGPFLLYVLQNPQYSLGGKIISLLGIMYGVFLNLDTISQMLALMMTALVGINFGLVAMKFDMIRVYDVKAQGTTFFGIMLGAFAIGCPACATGLLAILGVAGGLAVLPFQGMELKIASIVFLLASTGLLSHSLAKCNTCKI